MKIQTIAVYLVLGGIGLITSCKTSKNLYEGPPPQRSQQEVQEALNKRNIDFHWFSAKAGGDFESPQFGGSGSMQLRIKKDSLIWMIGKKFSIEGFRTIINKDSFYVVNRLERFYAAEQINSINRMFGMKMHFDDMQQLLAGNVFLPEMKDINSFTQNNEQCILSANIDEYKVSYVVNAYDLNLTHFEFKDRYNRKVIANFSNYKKLNKTLVPYFRKYEFYDASSIVAKLEIDVDEIEINAPKSMIFSIPSHYERVRF